MYVKYTDSHPLATAQELGIHFDKDGRYIAVQPYNATQSSGFAPYAPGHVFYVRGRKDHIHRGYMTQREAQIIINAVTRYGSRTSEADLYQSLMSED